eukprot:SAG11_NODE_36101_length_263_cov_0.902439_1_plen_56_part_10
MRVFSISGYSCTAVPWYVHRVVSDCRLLTMSVLEGLPALEHAQQIVTSTWAADTSM